MMFLYDIVLCWFRKNPHRGEATMSYIDHPGILIKHLLWHKSNTVEETNSIKKPTQSRLKSVCKLFR